MASPSIRPGQRYDSRIACLAVTVGGEQRLRAIRELARRLLRSKGVTVHHPKDWNQATTELSIRLSDIAPNLYIGINFVSNTDNKIHIDLIGEIGGVFANLPPKESELVWIPMENGTEWNVFISEVFAFASAGYPGCSGCGGADAELLWNEKTSRIRMMH
ncbi:MAG: hypothetical protein P8Q35_04140 [Candidatus Thalassarchaeaceae archaeon]|nr:hypothetical protein [Candidatus Thalassarchaeaceae archaeon]